MSDKRFETNKTPHVDIGHCQGNLLISGRMGQAVDISGEDFNAELIELDQIAVTSEKELDILVPSDSSLTLEQVQGQIIIKHVTGLVVIKEAHGEIHLKNLCSISVHEARQPLVGENVDGPITIVSAADRIELRNVGTLQIERAKGNIQIQYVTGDVDIGQVEGMLSLHSVSGNLEVAELNGNAQLSNLGGRNGLTRVNGRIHLAGSLAGGEHTFFATGDIIVLWPYDAPVSLIANASKVRCLLELENKVERENDQGMTTLTGHIEEGQAILNLKTPAKIGLKPSYDSGAEPPGPSDFAFDFQPLPSSSITTDSAAAPSAEPDQPSSFGDWLSDAITLRLRQSGLEMNPIQLRQLVNNAVATTLLNISDWPVTTGKTAGQPTAGQIAAESARKAVESSLRQAKESMDRLRRQDQPDDGEEKHPDSAQPTAQKKRSASISPAEKMVTDEQLNILNLLREGHITVQQAKTLLDALEQ